VETAPQPSSTGNSQYSEPAATKRVKSFQWAEPIGRTLVVNNMPLRGMGTPVICPLLFASQLPREHRKSNRCQPGSFTHGNGKKTN
ncbi:hypothetical protein LEMLEM_LOCUS8581, partial [Lemmus lemmus]